MNKETIKELVEQHYEIKIDTKTRKTEYVEARAMYFKLARDNTRLTLEAIGSEVNRHYSSVIHGITQLDGWMEKQAMVRNNYIVLKAKLKGIEDDAKQMIHTDESIVLQYATLKQEVKEQRETIEQLKKEYDVLYQKHHRREKFYAKYGFIG